MSRPRCSCTTTCRSCRMPEWETRRRGRSALSAVKLCTTDQHGTGICGFTLVSFIFLLFWFCTLYLLVCRIYSVQGYSQRMRFPQTTIRKLFDLYSYISGSLQLCIYLFHWVTSSNIFSRQERKSSIKIFTSEEIISSLNFYSYWLPL